MKVNPRGEVPCLVVGDDKILNDSSAILVYLAGKYGDDGSEGSAPSSYWSKDLYEQAQIINWVSFFFPRDPLHRNAIATNGPSSMLEEIITTGRWNLDVHDDHLLTSPQQKQLSFANSWIQYGVFTNRAILSYGGPFNGLGPGSNWPQSSIDVFLQEGAMRAEKSLKILEQHFQAGEEWLALGRPTVADLSVFVYVALAPMGDISLEPYPRVREWIGRIRGLRGFFGIEGLDDPMVLRR